ncbi:translation initiation factor IF-2 subunit beta [Candidatus Micrarchaeota archaeon]|nr:translation initiation factor IF-2 subunit beta [Candidatus Micrarchaeota archaeon]
MESYEVLLERVKEKHSVKTSSGERFETPVFVISLVGNKTYIKNFEDVAEKLRRSKEVLAKFLFKELATPGVITGQELILQAKVQFRLLQEKLQSFIERMVLCKECGKPDTHLEHHGRNVDFVVCEACGAKRPVLY